MRGLIRLDLTPEEAHALHEFVISGVYLASEVMRDYNNTPNFKEKALDDMIASIAACRELGLIETIEFLKEQAKREEG